MAKVYVLPDQKLLGLRDGEVLLDAGLRAGIPWAHACGGFAQCSTCRLVVLEGLDGCSPRTTKESKIADRLQFGEEFRLACQLTTTHDITVRRLVLDESDVETADVRPTVARVWLPRWLKAALEPFIGRLLRRHSRRHPIGVETEIAVLFADIRGFTPFAEAVLPYDVIHVLGRHLRDMTEIVERAGGRVTSYMGDGVMAVSDLEGDRAALRAAVEAAVRMVSHVESRRPALEDIYGRSFKLNAGIHTGTAIVGGLWGDHRAVTAIGDVVNVAARIEQANKEFNTSILVSDTVFAELSHDIVAGQSWCCELAGKSGTHQLYEVLDIKPPA